MIRDATHDDLELVKDLWREFEAEIPDADWRDDDSAHDVAELEQAIGKNVVLIAEEEGAPLGLAVAAMKGSRLGFLYLLHVRPQARGSGIATELVREAATQLRARGAEMLELEVLASNGDARAVYERWGFAPVELTLAAPVDALVERLSRGEAGPTFGTVHVQTDDAGAVRRAVERTLPRLGRGGETTVSEAENGWVRVRTELTDREPALLRRLAQELSYTTGGVVLALGVEDGAVVRYALYERGSIVDDYASVPEYRGPLPPGDVVALGANPRVVARLTGADPARVREIARTAGSPNDLPPALELYEQIGALMGAAV